MQVVVAVDQVHPIQQLQQFQVAVVLVHTKVVVEHLAEMLHQILAVVEVVAGTMVVVKVVLVAQELLSLNTHTVKRETWLH